jgi:hypothetical protein
VDARHKAGHDDMMALDSIMLRLDAHGH